MSSALSLTLYFLPLLLIAYVFARRRDSRLRADQAARSAAFEAGLTEPASLHPVIDPGKCIGCAACTAVCPEMPEHTVLGLINGKADLIGPTDCIGHGACQAACPVDAISLVFGTATRGVDIPNVKPNFETNVPGIFIAGELGGMGLIRNAIEQGKQAMEHLGRSLNGRADLDVLIIGAGPAGIAASLSAKAQQLNYLTLEQDSLGGAVAHFPRRKLVMTAPADLPLVGRMKFTEASKEKLLAFWQDVFETTQLNIRFDEQVLAVEQNMGGFAVTSSKGSYQTARILLCLGRRGTPRKLDVPGEDLPKVVYRLTDPEQYHGRKVLVVGGGDSAIEAACALAEHDNIDVTIAYRSAAFTRAKPKNRAAIEQAEQEGRAQVMFNTQVTEIRDSEVLLQQEDRTAVLPNDAVIVNAGGILPSNFLRSMGIEVDTKFGTA